MKQNTKIIIGIAAAAALAGGAYLMLRPKPVQPAAVTPGSTTMPSKVSTIIDSSANLFSELAEIFKKQPAATAGIYGTGIGQRADLLL